jgi:O-antigen/teichoic acid export membrane protein
MLKSALFVGLVAGLLGMGAMFVLGSAHVIKGFQTSTALIVMAPLVLAGALRSTLYGALRAFRDLRALVILKVAVPLIDVAAIGGLVLAGFRGVAAFAGALVAVAYVDLLLVSGFLRRGRNLGSLIDTTAADTKRLLAFSLPLVVTQLLYFGIQSLDVLLLGLLRNPVEAGLYSPVMRIMEAASKVLSAFPLLFVPVATAYVARGTPERLRELYISVTKWGYALGFPVILGVVVAPAPVLSLLFGPSYGEMDTVARVLAIGYWATLVTGLNGVSLSAVGAVKQMAWLSGAGMILNVGLALLLIGRYGPLGAAWSNTISYVSVNVAFSALLYRRTGISPFRRDSSLLFLYSGLLLALFIPLAGLPAMRATLPAMGLAVVAVAVWLVGGLFGRPFRMEWAEIRTILRPGRRGSRPSARVAPDGNGDRTLPQPADD